MNKTKAPGPAPSPKKVKQSSGVAKDFNPTTAFVSMALDMSWRLAIAVLVPIIAGIELDKHYKAHEWYLLLGFIIGVAAAVWIVYQSYKAANELVAGKVAKK